METFIHNDSLASKKQKSYNNKGRVMRKRSKAQCTVC